ncbi:MAG TPA: glycoside hydrolase family 2 TIM barrel-domain containing protein [Terriglobales bacterium]|nr:glycoside hydrolase family 2 TIM barrel-domain containing protein [Terriglobales bacterium]
MERRKFLKVAGRAGAGIGIAGPILNAGNLFGEVKRSPEGAPTLAISLDGKWLLATDAENVGRGQKWFSSPRPEARSVPVPSIIQEAFPAYHGVVWYWKTFEPQAHPYKGGRFLLRFNAVDYLSDVWLNGVHLGTHEGGETPFVLDATEAIQPGKSNSLTVRVLNPDDRRIDGITLAETPHRNKFVKYTNGALSDYGGIIESVDLLLTPAVHITDIFVRPNWKTGKVPITLTLQNTLKKTGSLQLHFEVSGGTIPQSLLIDSKAVTLKPGSDEFTHEIEIQGHRLWDIDDPFLYRLRVSAETKDAEGVHISSTTFGFRDFRVVNGYFRLNDRRIFVKSTHTGNHAPYRIISPPDGFADMLRKDLLYAKASGFNMVRFISGVTHPYELDMCDEIGLMVYEESSGSWLLKDSPQMKTRYEDSMRGMITRDRNHPCITLWGVLNETEDGAVYREAVAVLPFLRSLDDTRLLLLSSGRFDGHFEVGSLSNPGGKEWEYQWGKEAPGAAKEAMKYPSAIDAGDFHLYPKVPQTAEVTEMMRTLSSGGKPVFLSEYGIGSMMDVIHETRMYEQAGIPAEAEDFILVRSMAQHFVEDWARLGMDTAYPLPQTLLHESQAAMARHRLMGFNAIRSNPKICGYNLTGMLDHAFTGEGIWRFWRDWKPGAFDAMQDCWAPVRWCLFVEPTHTYVGRPFKIEAVLANEDVLRPGEYPAIFKLWGPNGTAWEGKKNVIIPARQDGAFAVPVLKDDITLNTPAGAYELVPYIEHGIAPPETSWGFHLTDASTFPRVSGPVTTWGLPDNVDSWLKAHGAITAPMGSAAPTNREVILVGDVSANATNAQWKALAEHMATGSTVIFLSPKTFKREKEGGAKLPLAKKGKVFEFNDWLYHKECVAKPHAVFEGLQARGLLDWYYYGPVLPRYVFEGQDTPAEVMAASFATGYSTPGGYACGILLGSYKFGAGQFVVNSFEILDNIDKHPVADRLLLNLINISAAGLKAPIAPLPSDFQSRLKEIGYAD